MRTSIGVFRTRPNRAWAVWAVLAAGFSTASEAQTTQCTVIDAIPYTIVTEGSYCFQENLTVTLASGDAVLINTDNVTIDLNGLKLANTDGASNQASGFTAWNHKNITLRNGTVRGFLVGLQFLDTSPGMVLSSGHLVEDVLADANTYVGIRVDGRGNVLRRNRVIDTGGTTALGANVTTFGLLVNGSANRAIDNGVTDTVAVGAGLAWNLVVAAGSGTVVANNRILASVLNADSFGLYLAATATNAVAVDNRFANLVRGIWFEVGSSGRYRDNLSAGCTYPYGGYGEDVGNNQ